MSALHFIPLTSTSPSFLGPTKGVPSPPSPVSFTCSGGSCSLPIVAPVIMGSSCLKAELGRVWALLQVSSAEVGEPMSDWDLGTLLCKPGQYVLASHTGSM